jgi:hypothetical protein
VIARHDLMRRNREHGGSNQRVSAEGEKAAGVPEQDAGVGVRRYRFGQQREHRPLAATRFADERPAESAMPLVDRAPLVSESASGQARKPAGHQPDDTSGRVRVDGGDPLR